VPQQTPTLQSSITVLSQAPDGCCSRCKILCLIFRNRALEELRSEAYGTVWS